MFLSYIYDIDINNLINLVQPLHELLLLRILPLEQLLIMLHRDCQINRILRGYEGGGVVPGCNIVLVQQLHALYELP